jgi:protein-S-isoprenylcysteine O-methyltransferase Ste14
MSRFVQRGGLWVVGQFVLLFFVVALGLACRNEPRRFPQFLSGLVFLTIAAVCGIAGILALGRNLTPFPRPSASARFVSHGIYAFMRHPLYTAVISGAFGWSLVWSSSLALLASLGLAVLLDAKARREEHWLRQQFPDYAPYQQRVRRFIPWIY